MPYPLLGPSLALLIIFMIFSGITPHHGSGPLLPLSRYASPMPRAVREDAQVVSISRDGQIYYRNVKVRVGDVPEQIRKSITNGADRKVYVRADTRAKYGDIERVLDEIRKTGIQNVCFFAEKVLP